MKNVVCQQCDYEQDGVNNFCVDCGVKLKCEKCNTEVAKNAKFCSGCGLPLFGDKVLQASNTFKLRETETERVIEASFSDNVGKDLAGILKDAYSPRVKGIPINSENFDKYKGEIETSTHHDFTEFESANEDFEGNIEKSESNVANNRENNINEDSYLTLKAVGMKNLASSDVEWLVLFSFYASNFGKDKFLKQQIFEKYKEANKFTPDTAGCFSRDMKRAVERDLINPLALGFSMLDKGIEKAKEILARTSSSSPKASRKIKSKNTDQDKNAVVRTKKLISKNSKSVKRLTDINFYPTGKESLEEFSKKYNFKSDSERTLVFVYYLKEILNIDKITMDHIYTCYDELKFKIPENMTASISNIKTRTGWIESGDFGFQLTTKGTNKIRHWDKKN